VWEGIKLISIKLKGIKESLSKLKLDSNKAIKIRERAIANNLLVDLEKNTPIDTGYARSEWKLKGTGERIEITNEAPYIEYLNRGSSKQAPAFFIETTALQYGEPILPIVESKPSTDTRV
jgi:hypothetical protein